MSEEVTTRVRNFLSRASPQQRRLFMTVMDVDKSTVARWQKKRQLKGKYALRAQGFLEIADIQTDQAISGSTKNLVIQAADAWIKTGLNLCELIVSDAIDAMDRQKLRIGVGEASILKLILLLNRMCGETAREVLKHREPGNGRSKD